MQATMMDVPLSLNHLLERAGTLFAANEDRLAPARQVAAAPQLRRVPPPHARAGRGAAAARPEAGDRVATLCWNHHAHLECYFGIPAAGGVMHTLNLRLAPDEIGWIAGRRAGPLPDRRRHPAAAVPAVRAPAPLRAGDRVPVLRRAGARREFVDYEALLGGGRPGRLRLRRSTTRTTRSRCATPRAPPAGPRAWSIRTARRCCTRWSAAWPTAGACAARDCVLPVTPMFHANCWGMPYARGDAGHRSWCFPGPHLHPDDLLDLMQLEPPTLSLGVPTIWLGLIQAYERALAEARRAGSCRRACARWSAARRCPSR